MNVTLKLIADDQVGLYIDEELQAIIHMDVWYDKLTREQYYKLKDRKEIHLTLTVNE